MNAGASKQKFSFKTAAINRLDATIESSNFVTENNISKSLIRKWIVSGFVYVNGKRETNMSKPIKGNVDVYYDLSTINSGTINKTKNFLPLRILYQDSAIICFDKPAGLPTQPTIDKKRENLFDLAKVELKKKFNESYLGLHHRLDRDTSGVILFVRDPQYNAHIADQFKQHKCHKTYMAVVHGKIENSKSKNIIETFIGEGTKKGKINKFASVHSGGKKAITHYHVLAHSSEFSLVEVRILTGRTHQIRVHMSELGHPIVGDTLYGSPQEYYNKLGRFLLHAHALSIEHPITKNSILIESPIPELFRIKNLTHIK